jgi:hypothetical protein
MSDFAERVAAFKDGWTCGADQFSNTPDAELAHLASNIIDELHGSDKALLLEVLARLNAYAAA